MAAPTPREFERQTAATLARVRRELRDAAAVYRTAYASGHVNAVRGDGGRGAPGAADPTLAVVGDPLDPRRPGAAAGARRACERAARRVVEVENLVGSLVPDLQSALDRFDPREGFEPVRYPVSITRAELDESRAAQERRRAARG